MIQFCRLPTFPPPPPPPFFVANPGGGGRQHPRPGTSPKSHRRRCGLFTPLRRPLCHIVGVIIFIIALSQIVFGRGVRVGTYLLFPSPCVVNPRLPPPTSPLFMLFDDPPQILSHF